MGKTAPYRVYEMARNEGLINLVINSDTATFVVNSVRQWWDEMGMARYAGASNLYITADGGVAMGAGIGSGRLICSSWRMRRAVSVISSVL